MDDATASDNCGEVTIEVSSETTAGDAAGNYTIVRTFTATDDAETALSTQTITVHTTEVHLVPPTTRLSAPMRCRWTTLQRQTTAVSDDRSVQRDHRAMLRATTRSFARSLRRRCWKHVCYPDHHSSGHHSSRVSLRPSRLHG